MTDLSVLRDAEVTALDFRRPSLLSREDMRGIGNAHEVFTRRLATRWSSRLRALVQIEPAGVDQALYDDYLRSMPTPSVLGVVGLHPLPGAALVEVNSQLALRLVDRMLGGAGTGLAAKSDATRRPTELEDALVRDLVGQVASALVDAHEPLAESADVLGVDYSPQQVQIAAPSDVVVVLTYRVGVTQGVECEGLLSVCYPAVTLRPVLEQIQDSAHGTPVGEELDADTARRSIVDRLEGVTVELSVALGESDIQAGELARLREGDVLRLDHPIGQPVLGHAGDARLLEGHVGRRGRRLAFQVSGWLATTPAPALRPSAPPATTHASEAAPAVIDRRSQ